MFLDADDSYAPNIVRLAYDKQKEADVDVVYFGINEVNEKM